ncbi:MAG: hypothetical protein NZ556_08665 [Fimbriimonadales bacterium]|nr:hypothetical protein [Fimbriimonadales bacterium]
MPAELQAHLARCVACQRVWRAEQAYRRALQAARSEPMPVCDLPWTRIQARLAERAVARPRLSIWRFAPAFGIGIAALAVFAASLLFRAPAPDAPAQVAQEPAVRLAIPSSEPAPTPRVVAQATPLRSSATRLQTPPAQQPAPPNEGGFKQGVQTSLSLPANEAAQATNTAQTAATARNQITAHYQRATAPNASAVERAEPLTLGMSAPAEAPPESLPTQIASLPLNQIRLLEGDNADYLPFNYGTRSLGENDTYAPVGSF